MESGSQKKEKVFITGANGMLGSHICRHLLNRGYVVKAICLNGAANATINTLPIELVIGDILDADFISSQMAGCDYVIHVAAMTNVWPRRLPTLREVNIEGTKNIVAAAETHHIKRMIHVGSASSFEHGPKFKPGNETSAYQGWKHGMDYLDSKFIAQEWLVKKFHDSAFPVIVVNPTFMVGAYDSGPSSGQLLINLYNGKLPGYTGGGKNFVCTNDVATAIVNALKIGRLGECYIAGNENLSYKEFFVKAAQVMQKEFKLHRMPMLMVLMVGAAASLKAKLSGKKPKISYGIARFSVLQQYFSPQKAREELAMPQTPIEIGMSEALTWFKANNYLKN